jgi:hypothetical protein
MLKDNVRFKHSLLEKKPTVNEENKKQIMQSLF